MTGNSTRLTKAGMNARKPAKKRSGWKKLTKKQERAILKHFDKGMPRTGIMRMYKIPDGQFYSIIRSTTGIRKRMN